MKEVAAMRPWTVELHYRFARGFSPGGPAFDKALFAVAGRSSDGSGAGGSFRDHFWSCRTNEEALGIAQKLSTMPGIETLEVRCDILQEMLCRAIEKAKKEGRLHKWPGGTASISAARRQARRGKRLRRVRGKK